MRRSEFIDEFQLFDIGLFNSKRFPPWRQQTGSDFLEPSPVCPMVRSSEPTELASDSKQPPKNHFGHTGTAPENNFRFAAATVDICPESTAVVLHSRNTSSIHVQTVGSTVVTLLTCKQSKSQLSETLTTSGFDQTSLNESPRQAHWWSSVVCSKF